MPNSEVGNGLTGGGRDIDTLKAVVKKIEEGEKGQDQGV